MWWFLIPLMVGFASNSASAFTGFYSRRYGERIGKLVSIVLRDLTGIPIWAAGYGMAAVARNRELISPHMFISVLAWVLVASGAVVIIAGFAQIRWKAAAPSVKDKLVTIGIYGHIRHPLYSGMILELIGLAIWVPKATVLVACLIGIVWSLVQARLEEIDLVERLPVYREYMQHVPRFISRLRKGLSKQKKNL